jgi:hypothetical protein
MAMMGLVHIFSFFVARRDKTRPLKIHQRRDLAAAIEILRVLLRMGYELGESILSFPPEKSPPPEGPEGSLYPVDLSFVKPGDVLLQTTRPPIHDVHESPRKKVERGFTDLERPLFDVWGQYIAHCARSHMELHEALHDALPAGYENRRGMEFREAIGAPYKALNDFVGSGWRNTPKSERRTSAFLLRVEEAWEGGPGLIGAFGVDGTATLVWAYRLGRDLSHLLEEPGFVVAEMKNTGVPDRPTDLRWAMDWKVEVLFRYQV